MPLIEAGSCTNPALERQRPGKWGFPSTESRVNMLSWLANTSTVAVISKRAEKSLA
jgi:hypothetical protein